MLFGGVAISAPTPASAQEAGIELVQYWGDGPPRRHYRRPPPPPPRYWGHSRRPYYDRHYRRPPPPPPRYWRGDRPYRYY
ncbi:hypothetical protein BV133_3314 [Blastochloris viridis]|nr:hypothetical protein BV133_3314 [Blastochloris viridis]